MTDTMTITQEHVGKYVRLRDGSKAYILAVVPFEILIDEDCRVACVCGRGEDGDEWFSFGCSLNGRCYGEPQSDYDIMGLWVDEEPERPWDVTFCEIGHLKMGGRIKVLEEQIEFLENRLQRIEQKLFGTSPRGSVF